jgi:hypothetical protein
LARGENGSDDTAVRQVLEGFEAGALSLDEAATMLE